METCWLPTLDSSSIHVFVRAMVTAVSPGCASHVAFSTSNAVGTCLRQTQLSAAGFFGISLVAPCPFIPLGSKSRAESAWHGLMPSAVAPMPRSFPGARLSAEKVRGTALGAASAEAGMAFAQFRTARPPALPAALQTSITAVTLSRSSAYPLRGRFTDEFLGSMIDAESPLMSRRCFPSDQKGPEGTDVMTMPAGDLMRFPLRCLGANRFATLERDDLMEV
jgi:hypothetical protein